MVAIQFLSRTGHSFIKKKLKETNAELAGEMSGHIFFKERWYGFDDALYTGARLLEIVSNSDKTCSEIFDELPVNLSTPEININFEKHGQQYEAMESLSNNIDFPDASVNTIDGFRVDYEELLGSR
jgi:phosphomannomutase/phosphoglucomutase